MRFTTNFVDTFLSLSLHTNTLHACRCVVILRRCIFSLSLYPRSRSLLVSRRELLFHIRKYLSFSFHGKSEILLWIFSPSLSLPAPFLVSPINLENVDRSTGAVPGYTCAFFTSSSKLRSAMPREKYLRRKTNNNAKERRTGERERRSFLIHRENIFPHCFHLSPSCLFL